jgi:MFS superfamily sulfate permease-like transporter
MASPWLLVISKSPEYGPTGEVVPGQCEPFTAGWKLRLYSDGKERVLLTGTYYELRRIQKRCTGMTVEEIEQMAEEARERMESGVDETAIVAGVGAGPMAGSGARESEIATSGDFEGDDEETDDFIPAEDLAMAFETQARQGVLVARVSDPMEFTRGPELESSLPVLMRASRGALVLDIESVHKLDADTANRLGRFTYSVEQQGGFVALANVTDDVVSMLQDMEIEGTLIAFVDLASAIAEGQAFLVRRAS